MKTRKATASEIDGVQYRHSATWRIALGQMNGAVGMCFYILMTYASYIASSGYGIATAVVGIILTGTRLFDGITDPIIAVIIDKTNTRFGKIRPLMALGWVIETLAVFLLYIWAAGIVDGVAGVLLFIVLYMLYVAGYTLNNVTGQIIPSVMTNDPKQRPTVSVWSTAYNYIAPMVLSIVVSAVILPMYGNEYSLPMLATTCKVCVAVSLVLLLLCFIGVSNVDRPEFYADITAGSSKEKVKLKDMWNLLRSNKPLQCYIISAASDKLAQQTTSQSIITTMLYGILMGNMGMSTILSAVSMFPSIIFAAIGARYAGKHGNKETIVTWTWLCLCIAAGMIAFFGCVDMSNVLTFLPFTILFMVLNFGLSGAKMGVTVGNSAFMADIIDYELDRSGKYLPAAVTATYSFVDKLISSLGSTIATACVALIGYTTTMPQPTDEATWQIKWMTLGLMYFLPIVGWVCTLCAMKHCNLDKPAMVEVQKRIADKKAAVQQEQV